MTLTGFKFLILLMMSVTSWQLAHAQSDGDEAEAMFSGEDDTADSPPPAPVSRGSEKEEHRETPKADHLTKLTLFQDIAVIQRRYLPKSGRFEFFLGGGLSTNDAFFNNIGGLVRAGYHINDNFAVEGTGLFLGTSQKDSTKKLETDRGIITTALVTPESYYGLDVVWSPGYGKMALFNKGIVPFDFYLSGGAGTTKTNQGNSALTFHVGLGQIYALSKWMAFRWDFSWNFFNAKSDVAEGPSNEGMYDNLFLTVGFSFFFPEATYR